MENNLLLSSLSRSHPFETLRVEGQLPPSLKGTLYRAGPGLFERFGRTLPHAFEADGAISAVRFGDGKAQGAARIVESEGYLREQEQGRYLYNSAASWWTRMLVAWRGEGKTTGNTSIFAWQGRLFALMEGGLAQEIDSETLQAGMVQDFGVVQNAFSAHPHRVAALDCSFNFGVRYGKKMFIDLYALPDSGNARHLTTVDAPWMSMVHDFAATDRHLILFVGPVKLSLWRAMLGLSDYSKLFEWKPELGARIIVVPLSDVNRTKTFELEAFWAWHFVNAFEDGDEIAVDVCKYEDFSSLAEIGSLPNPSAPHQTEESLPMLSRMHLDSNTGRSHWSQRCADPVEFPQVHPRVQGARHQSIFAQGRDARGDTIACIDDSGATSTWLVPPHLVASEPVLVPRSPKESDVWVLDLILDRDTSKSHVAILDGQHLADGPVASVHFDHAVPLTFHGTFVAS